MYRYPCVCVPPGEQHDLHQYLLDFLEFYRMDAGSAQMLANEVHKRLPPVALQIPVSLTNQRKVAVRFSEHDNVTAVVEAFMNVFEAEPGIKVQLLKYARAGLAPGTYVV